MGDQIAAWHRRENDGNVNATFFNKLANGVEVVFKPEGLGYGIARLRGSRYYNIKVREVEREKCAYELDRVLGIGLVPPVVVREDTIPEKYMKELKDFKEGEDPNMQLGKWPGHGDWKAKGSAMYKVPNSENWAGSEMRRRAVTNGVSSLPKHTQFDLMKMACFDYITGTTDRHYRNLMVDPQGRLAAIDHGLCFPWNADPKSSNPMTGGSGFRSEPFNFLVDDHALRGKLDSDIIKHLKTIKKPDLMAAMKPYKLEQEGEHCWMRLQALVKAGRLSRDLLKSDAWYESGGVT
jgi:hypothetical protein